MSSLFRLFKGDSRGEISGPFFFFLVQSRIAVYALNRTRRVGLSALRIAENKIRGSFRLKGYSTDSMTSRGLKSHRNEHAVRGRSTRKEVEHFWNGLAACPSRDQFTSEHLWVKKKKKRIMLYQMSYQILILIKRIFRSVIVFFRRDRAPSTRNSSTNSTTSNSNIKLCDVKRKWLMKEKVFTSRPSFTNKNKVL